MEKSIEEQSEKLEEQAMLIASEIFSIIDQYTDDSNISKFFLTDNVAAACYGLAGGFASAIYTPALEVEEIQDTTILSFMYALMTYGFNIYLKERSLLTNGAPYKMPQDPVIIKKVKRRIVSTARRGKLVSTPLADKIIKILITNIKDKIRTGELSIKGHRLNRQKFFDYCKLSMYWGYNFSRELLAS
jgi:hypothetical protein